MGRFQFCIPVRGQSCVNRGKKKVITFCASSFAAFSALYTLTVAILQALSCQTVVRGRLNSQSSKSCEQPGKAAIAKAEPNRVWLKTWTKRAKKEHPKVINNKSRLPSMIGNMALPVATLCHLCQWPSWSGWSSWSLLGDCRGWIVPN